MAKPHSPFHGEPTNHTGWQRCFNASGVRAAYATAIYGTSAAAREQGFNWSHVDVILPPLIPSLNRTCFDHAEQIYRRHIIGFTFVDYPDRANIPNGRVINRGGPRAAARVVQWPLTEVLHSPGYSHGMVDEQLWMYVARGTGLWFDPGRVLELSDTFDLALYLNSSYGQPYTYNYRSTGSKSILMRNGAQALHVTKPCVHRLTQCRCCSVCTQLRSCSLGRLTALRSQVTLTVDAASAWSCVSSSHCRTFPGYAL